MTRRYLFVLLLVTLWFGAEVGAAEVAAKVGIIKGTITVGGKPTADVVVSVEGVAPDIV